MTTIENDTKLIARCGLYCGACRAYKNGKCPGCAQNVKAEKWCAVKNCCAENGYNSCADCKTYENVNDCKKFNNFISKTFALVFGSDRKGCINYIRQEGYTGFAAHMVECGRYNKP